MIKLKAIFCGIIFSTLINAVCISPAQARQCAVDAAWVIYPAPREACLGDTAAVPPDLKYHVSAPEFTDKNGKRFEEIFKAHGIVFSQGSENDAAVRFVVSPEEHAGAFRDEGYKLSITAAPLTITVAARSETGFLYAAVTLGQMLRGGGADATVYTGEINDFPAFLFRGVLEGGYDVWQRENRSNLIDWMGRYKMNYFIYAPKEDPYFRRQWRKPFPPEIIDEYREYLAICEKHNIIFAFSLSPALNMEYSNPSEFKTLLAKYRQIQDLGVDNFGIFFDDVLPYLSTPADKARFENIAEAEVYVSNMLLEYLKKNDPDAKLFFVPNQYWGWTDTVYFKILREQLNPEIQIGWTGIDIVSETITRAHAEKFIHTVGRPPAIGDNYSPMGAIVRRDPDLHLAASSFVNNPYDFAEDEKAQLSRFVNATVGDYAWNPPGYAPARSITMEARIESGSEAGGEALLLALILTERTVEMHSRYKDQIAQALPQTADAAKIDTARTAIETALGALRSLRSAPMEPLLLAQLEPGIAAAEDKLRQALTLLDAARDPAAAPDALGKIKKLLKL
jgi:hyaluronoglucosaminidase